MKLPPEILLATNNGHKAAEIRAILGGEGTRFLLLKDYPGLPAVVEDGNTFEANALKKAIEICRAAGLPSLADDSGLEVDALNGAPGVHSARYSGGGDLENNRLMLRNLEGLALMKRTARFRCVAVLALPGGRTFKGEGRIEGRIGFEPRGSAGFGYDPLFVPEGLTRTFAEIGEQEKNAMSHRGRALAGLLSAVRAIP